MRGYVGTARLAGSKAILFLRRLSPSYRQAARKENQSDLEFDRKYGIETSGNSHPEESEVQGTNWVHGNRYQAVNPTTFNQVIKDLALEYKDFVFIDFGSGKGRAVLLAAGFPFKKVVGVEYSNDLDQLAKRNLGRYPEAAKTCKDIELICMDASEYTLPNEPLVLYFYNPFGRPVMEKVIQNVRDSFQSNRRRILVVSLTAYESMLWDEVSFLKKWKSQSNVWDSELVNHVNS
jgi:hypothetical protein